MRRTTLGTIAVLLFAVLAHPNGHVQSQTRSNAQRPETAKPTANDFKITYRTTTSGQSYQSSTMIKGARERNEMNMGAGMDMVTITQCDLKRTIQLSERTRKYVITPMETVDQTSSPSATVVAPVEAARRGGVVTYTSTATDTGERKEMFGFTARHIKTSLEIESSPDACSPMKQKMETDGWYIDLAFGMDCDRGRTQVPNQPMVNTGCRDRVQFRRHGVAKIGYPVSETTTMYGPDGRVMFTSTKEVIELSRAPLDAALFDVPSDYTEARDTQELYGIPSMETMMNQASQGQTSVPRTQTTPDRTPAKAGLRVGVVSINNKTNKEVSLDSLRERLIAGITSAGIEAVPLNALSKSEAEIEAKVKQCDFILFTDLAALKTSKLGGMFGRVTGVEGAGKTEAKIEYRLFAVGETTPRLQMTASAKLEGEEASTGTAIDTEAKQVVSTIKK